MFGIRPQKSAVVDVASFCGFTDVYEEWNVGGSNILFLWFAAGSSIQIPGDHEDHPY